MGEQLAKGRPWKAIHEEMRNVAEGVDTTLAALEMAASLHVDMPITACTHRVLFQGLDPRDAVAALMSREPQPEWRGLGSDNT